MSTTRAAIAACLLVCCASEVRAHPAPFSYLDLRLDATGLDISLVVHDFDVAHDVGVNAPELLLDAATAAKYREQLTRLMQSRIALFVNGQLEEMTATGFETLPERQSLRLAFRIDGARPASLRIRAVVFPYDPIHQTFINVYENNTLRHQAILDADRSTADYYAGTWQGTAAVLGVFVPAGIEHILIGPDHVLFLIALLLMGGSVWRLTTIVTAFTLGHSITLTLAALDVVAPPAAVVEPVIALSIVFVGVDNLLVQRDGRAGHGDSSALHEDGRGDLQVHRGRVTAPRDIRAWVAGVFGLVHGFGFASVLKELGLPTAALGWSLFSFNVGVEIGQLAIVTAVAISLRAVARRSAGFARQLAFGGSLVVILAGVYWFIERVFLTGGA